MRKILSALVVLSLLLHGEDFRSKTLLERLAQPKLSLQSSYLADASVKGSEGSVKVFKNRLMLNNEFIGFSYTNWKFKWQEIEVLPFGDGKSQPIEQMHRLSLDARLPYRFNDKWFSLSSLSLRSTFEKSMHDALSVVLFSFASYKAADAHTIQVGAFANYHPVSTLVLPALSYSYRARMNDGFQFILGFPRTYIGYHLNRSTLLRLGAIYSQSMIRLSNESSIAAAGFVEAKDYMGSLGVTYRLIESIELKCDLLYAFRRDFVTYTQNGSKIDAYSIEPSSGLDIKLVWWL